MTTKQEHILSKIRKLPYHHWASRDFLPVNSFTVKRSKGFCKSREGKTRQLEKKC